MAIHSYRAYGLSITSNVPLPELHPSEGSADVTIRVTEPIQPATEVAVAVTPDQVVMRWPFLATFTVRANEVVAEPYPSTDPTLLRLAILGPALAAMLQRRGYLVLHASGAEVEHAVAAFMGESGQGKSTMAAAMHARGFPVVADDLVAVSITPGGPLVFSGFPRLKLYPDSLRAIGEEPERFAELHPAVVKRGHMAQGAAPHIPLSLRRVYLLQRGEAAGVEPLRGVSAMMELTRHTFGKWMLDESLRRSQFEQTAELAAQQFLCRLIRGPLEQIDDAVNAVVRDCQPVEPHAASPGGATDPHC